MENQPEQAAKREQDTKQDPLRETFVEMLFALAVAQIAIVAEKLAFLDKPLLEEGPAIAHLFVALILISSSWVGWRRSKSQGMKEKIESVFGLPYVGLLLDVFLVILYFILVQAVEVKQSDPPELTTPSARPEAKWLLVIFFVYVIWDLITDVVPHGAIANNRSRIRWIFKCLCASIVSTFASVLSLALIFGVFLLAKRSVASVQVICLDVALVMVIFLFRAAKALEIPLSRWLAVEDCTAFRKHRFVHTGERLGGWVCFVGYIALMAAVVFWHY